MITRRVGLLALALSLPLAGCGDALGSGEPGTLTLMLTDAAGDFTQAVVEIERIELIGEGQPVVLRDTPFVTNLLTLSNDVATLVEDETVPGGQLHRGSVHHPGRLHRRRAGRRERARLRLGRLRGVRHAGRQPHATELRTDGHQGESARGLRGGGWRLSDPASSTSTSSRASVTWQADRVAGS